VIDTEILEEAVRRHFGDVGRFAAVAVGSGSANRSWHFEHRERRIIAKFPEARGGLTVAPALEFELLRLAAQAGIAPWPLAFDPATNILFVEYLSGSTNELAARFPEPGHIEHLVQLLGTLHALDSPVSLRRFEPLAFADAYVEQADEAVRRDAAMLRDECAELAQRVEKWLTGSQICHNDLHAGNIVFGAQAWLIDFEYAVQAAPIVDVASFVAWNDLDEAAAVALAHARFGTDLPFSMRELRAIADIHLALGALWEIARGDHDAAG
jgi:Ser/Thr protein kinase RdoA (MazF antagonist)